MKSKTKNIVKWSMAAAAAGSLLLFSNKDLFLGASSHREAPLIANDPLADNTDLYAFRSPDDTNTVTIIANFVPFELPQGGPNYYSFGENIRYEVHIKNDPWKAGIGKDEITYRFTFSKINEDPTTFFNIRLGKQNLKTTYNVDKSLDGGITFTNIVTGGIVPPNNIGPRSIQGTVAGLGKSYETIRTASYATATGGGGEQIFCGPSDDPFFVDLGGIFDLGMTRAGAGARDGLAKYNVHSIVIKAPISTLQKDGKSVMQRKNILDSDYIIGVWASASRPKIRTLNVDGTMEDNGPWIQVSRLGMPLTNEAIIPIGDKDKWNVAQPYNEGATEKYFTNPELALYMDDDRFGTAVPAFSKLRIQSKSLGLYDFRNGMNGVSGLKGNPAMGGTAFADTLFGSYLLRAGEPRSVDLLPIFHTGVPNLIPYQLATGKNGNPLAAGKPFINNFLPTFGDMLRLNMAVPVTPRNSADFSNLGLIQAAVLGLTDERYNKSAALQFIPNMDGFPNGRRLEDDVTKIELQAVSGVVLAAIGLWYDDYIPGTSTSAVTTGLTNVLGYTTGVEKNDTTFLANFPYVQTPWSGYEHSGSTPGVPVVTAVTDFGIGIGAPELAMIQNFPNPFVKSTTIKYKIAAAATVKLTVFDMQGGVVATLVDEPKTAGTYEVQWNAGNLPSGVYVGNLTTNGNVKKVVKMTVIN